ncbi:hypothetical protein [Neobacillus sp. YIM B06451]|nr:hypothetical protein [Neobacillus sp. YIM B06451]
MGMRFRKSFKIAPGVRMTDFNGRISRKRVILFIFERWQGL